jgi:hypothetical protein
MVTMRATRFNIKMFYLLSTEYIYVFCEVLKNRMITASYSFKLLASYPRRGVFTAPFELPPQCLRFVLVLSGLRISTTRKYPVKINGSDPTGVFRVLTHH